MTLMILQMFTAKVPQPTLAAAAAAVLEHVKMTMLGMVATAVPAM